MIQPEPFSDVHAVFKYFRDVTSPAHFLRSKELVPPPFRLLFVVLSVVAFLVAVWILHFFNPCLLVLPKHFSFIHLWSLAPILMVVLVLPLGMGFWLRSRWIKRRLKEKRILEVIGWFWLSPQVEQLMLQEFTGYLATKGFYNPEALNLLIENTRDEIAARWRPNPVVLTVITVGIALLVAYYQVVLSRYLELQVGLPKGIKPYALLGVLSLLIVLVLGFIILPPSWFFVASSYLSLRSERAIYMHCLSEIRLSLLKTYEIDSA